MSEDRASGKYGYRPWGLFTDVRMAGTGCGLYAYRPENRMRSEMPDTESRNILPERLELELYGFAPGRGFAVAFAVGDARHQPQQIVFGGAQPDAFPVREA